METLCTCHILVIDDNYDDFELIEHQLALSKEAAPVMEHCDSLASGLKRLRSGGIDIVLLDLSLPDSQAVDTVKNVRICAPTVPIVVLTGINDNEIALASLQCGAEDYLVKGVFDASALSRSINYALARNAAREATGRLATIVNASDDAIIGEDLNGVITSWNKGAAKLFGYSEEEATGKSISMIIPAELLDELSNILKIVASGEAVHNMETVRVKKNGERIDVLLTVSPISCEDGTVIGAASIKRDITERKETQKVLEESEERYRLLVAGVKDYAIFMLDPNGFVESWNEGAKRIKGYEAAEIIGKHMSVFYTTEDQQLGIPASHLKAAVDTGSLEDRGWRLRKDNSRFFSDVVITPLFDHGGVLRGFANVTRDVTERELAQLEIADAKLRMSLALEAASIGVWDYDRSSNSVWKSLQHDEIFGYPIPPPEWNLDIAISHVVPEERASVKEALVKGMKAGTFRMQCRIIKADSKDIRWISVRGESFRNEQGVPVRMMGTVADITDIKEKQDRLRRLAIMNEREDFMATLTHDMKNPLIGANRLIDLFIAGHLGKISSQQCEIFQCLKESNSALLKLMADLIDVYRLEKDVSILLKVECDLVHTINVCVSRVAPFAKLRSIEVIAQLSAEMIVHADASRLERVVQNLLDNALKFVPDGGTIQIRMFKVDANAIIEIEDNGQGVTLEEQSRLFKRFSQASAGKRYTGGSGLGLYLCKQIVEAHGGKIECQSQPNQSTIFRVLLPLENKEGEGVS
ncbi:MAG: PAS domain S-box protein [Candidatus Obscuribacterales bacterium]|nr:PAS domain S-box protein [Candidatus Obscuribacterales bacterium]